MEFIDSQIGLYADLADAYTNLGNLHDKKLWHQLSLALEAFVSDHNNIRHDNMLQLYTKFITTFESRLNQVKLAGLASLVGRIVLSQSGATAALAFFEEVLSTSRSRLGVEATLCVEMDVVRMKILLGEAAAASDLLQAAKEQLTTIKSSESVAFSKYYKATADYRKVVGPANEFYSAALMFLAYTHMDDISADDKRTLAADMALASVTGDDIFNFGEVIATPILAFLKDTPQAWLQDLVLAMNTGDVSTFNSIVEAYQAQYFAQPALKSKHDMIVEKVKILSLLNIAFERPPHDRQISFQDIAARAKIPLDQVEWILMRAMSKGLIKGVIDGVDSVVSVTWVQPRVLDKAQLGLLNTQLEDWSEKVKQALLTIEDQTVELYV